MNKKKVASIVLLSGLVLGQASVVLAAESHLPSKATTESKIILEENDGKTSPVDPTDPTKPGGEDEDNEKTKNQGPLSLDVAPKSFDFGTQKMYQSEHTYNAKKTKKLQYLQVTDNRDVGQLGWTVTVKQDGYLKTEKGYELSGAYLALPKRETRNSLAENPTEDVSYFFKDALGKGQSKDNGEIHTEEIDVFKTKDDKEEPYGKGTSVSSWKADEVSLTIPANIAKAGNYTTNVVWTLTAGAEN